MPFIKSGDQTRVTLVVPGVIALAIMSTVFTAQAISVGFDRRYGVLKLLGVTPLSCLRLLLSKTIAILVIEAIQIVLIIVVALLLGWRPVGNPVGTFLLVILGTAAFSALSFALAGVLRAEATLAAANAITSSCYLLEAWSFQRDQMPAVLGSIAQLLPSGALGNGLRDVMAGGTTIPATSLVLLVWFAIGTFIAARTFLVGVTR